MYDGGDDEQYATGGRAVGLLGDSMMNIFFFPAGIAKGPTPAIRSQTASPGWNFATSRSCSVCNRLFQYTSA